MLSGDTSCLDALHEPQHFVAAGPPHVLGQGRHVPPLFKKAGHDQEREREREERPEEKQYLAGRCCRSARCHGEMD
jgi:hypothetical protein